MPDPLFLLGVSVSGPMFLPRGFPPGGLCPGGQSRTETPHGQRGSVQGGSLSGRPMDRNLPYSEERAVRILLECFLVFTFDLFGPIWGGCLSIKLVR